jgi:hypothetical protein
MDRKVIDRITLVKGKENDIVTGKPSNFSVQGLPSHLKAEVKGTDQSRYRYRLSRDGDLRPYEPNQGSPTPEAALEALKNLLNWDPA